MYIFILAFFGTVKTLLVRHGEDSKIHPIENHTLLNVYGEMFLQICRDYSSLPDPRSLKLNEIRFYYNGLRSELKEHTRPKGK